MLICIVSKPLNPCVHLLPAVGAPSYLIEVADTGPANWVKKLQPLPWQSCLPISSVPHLRAVRVRRPWLAATDHLLPRRRICPLPCGLRSVVRHLHGAHCHHLGCCRVWVPNRRRIATAYWLGRVYPENVLTRSGRPFHLYIWIVIEYLLTGECPWTTTQEPTHKHHEDLRYFMCRPVKLRRHETAIASVMFTKLCCCYYRYRGGKEEATLHLSLGAGRFISHCDYLSCNCHMGQSVWYWKQCGVCLAIPWPVLLKAPRREFVYCCPLKCPNLWQEKCSWCMQTLQLTLSSYLKLLFDFLLVSENTLRIALFRTRSQVFADSAFRKPGVFLICMFESTWCVHFRSNGQQVTLRNGTWTTRPQFNELRSKWFLIK